MNYKTDPIGFNPTANQSEFGTPQRSGYGNELRATVPYGSFDYFPTFPYRHDFDYVGVQLFSDPITSTLYYDSFGYRGITPLSLQPIYDLAEPWQEDGIR